MSVLRASTQKPFEEVLAMKHLICLSLLALTLTGCAGKTAYRDSCASNLDAAWKEQSLAEAEGFAGTVSYSKRSEEHTSELQSRENLVCRLLLEKKKRNRKKVGIK